jgi:hypothetical protein
VEGSGEGSSLGDLGKGGTGLGHNGAHASQGVGTSLGLSETISGSSLGVEDSGVNLSDLVGSWAWDDTSLDTKSGGVSASITSLSNELDAVKQRRKPDMLTMTAILPWAATRGDAARARMMILENIFAVGLSKKNGLKIEDIKIVCGY